MSHANPSNRDHNLVREVYSVLPVLSPIDAREVAERVYERYCYSVEDFPASALKGAVVDRLRGLVAQGRAEKVGEGWRRRSGAAPSSA